MSTFFPVSQEISLPSASQSTKDVQLFENQQKASQAGSLIHSLQMQGQPSNIAYHLQNVNTAYL